MYVRTVLRKLRRSCLKIQKLVARIVLSGRLRINVTGMSLDTIMYVFKFKGLMQLIDVREDDLFLYTDGDELPRPEILQFFKLYDGWSQPVAFQYKWSIYGFFWQVDGKVYGAYSRPIPSMVSQGVCTIFSFLVN